MMLNPLSLRWLAPAAIAATAALTAAPERSITLDRLPLLFADDSGVASRDGVVRTFHPGTTLPGPVLTADRPWEGNRVYIFGSVMRTPGSDLFRMWYSSHPVLEHARPSASAPAFHSLTLYATSTDGISWVKPPLGLVSAASASGVSTANNIVSDFDSPSVLLDATEADPARRYKMLGALHGAYAAAYSADGLRWKMYPHNPVLQYSDTITLTQDPVSRRYLAYHKRPAVVRGFPRRVVWLATSADFQNWSQPELVFAPDAEDDAWTSRPGERAEIYNMSVVPSASGFIGFPAVLRVMKVRTAAETLPGQSSLDGPVDIQIATSEDGRAWRRSWPRISMIPRGAPGTFDGGALLGVASQPVDTAELTWIYYTAINTGHGGTMPPKRTTIGRAEWRLHGFVSLDAGPMGAEVETRPLRLSGGVLSVNADASRGELRVALLEADGSPVSGYTVEDCEPLRTDQVRFQLRWKSSPHLPINRPLRAKIEMTNTSLYSLSAEAIAR